jgi:hypothetical protein
LQVRRRLARPQRQFCYRSGNGTRRICWGLDGMTEQLELASLYGMRTEQFSELGAFRVREVLLVASPYDAFVLEEDGQLGEMVFQEYRNLELNIGFAPRFVVAESASVALEYLGQQHFDLIVTTAKVGDLPLSQFAARAKATQPDVPIGVLAAHAWELPSLEPLHASGVVDCVYLWPGDASALLAMILQEEDRRNAEHDIAVGGVQAIILVEDDARFLSYYLPRVYAEVTRQTARLVAEGLNPAHRLLRLQARPKILLARTFEQAEKYLQRFGDNLLGVISDVAFPRAGKVDPGAGVELVRVIRNRDPGLSVLLQSSDASSRDLAESLDAPFLHKESPAALDQLRAFMLEGFGFGDFVFRLPSGAEIGRAANIRQFLVQIERAPGESIEFHANRNHFSRWFAARTEFELAEALRPRTVAEFPSIDGMRAYLAGAVARFLREIQRHVITDYEADIFDEFVSFAKIGSGSLGGKGRGLAFMKRLLAQARPAVEDIEIVVPQSLVLASDIFDEFMAGNQLRALLPALDKLSDSEILDAFRHGRFGHALRADLARFLAVVTEPIAVRSSSILEDSAYQPFAGVYATVMLPNNHPSLDVRLAQLLEALKVVYASTYVRSAREYLATTPHRLEEEAMAVLIQRLVGSRRGTLMYPTFSGVASSYNYYPFRDMKPRDGVALVALGLGKAVTEGFEALRFCPAFPLVLPQFSATKDVLKNAQRRFWALDLTRSDFIPGPDPDATLCQLDLGQAFSNGSATPIASTYLKADDTLVDGVKPDGVPLVTFSRMLRGQGFPLPAALRAVLELAESGMSNPVEIEFAVDIVPGARAQAFHLLQARPIVAEAIGPHVVVDEIDRDSVIAMSHCAMGHNRGYVVHDLVFVLPALDRARTVEAAAVLEGLNQRLQRDGRPYVLVGPGRWGTRDPWLGIPVAWSQISAARAIVETDFVDFEVEPSQGSHFFHNLTAFGVAFLAVHPRQTGGVIRWSWLEGRPPEASELGGVVRHIRVEQGVEVLVDGASRTGIVRLRSAKQC